MHTNLSARSRRTFQAAIAGGMILLLLSINIGLPIAYAQKAEVQLPGTHYSASTVAVSNGPRLQRHNINGPAVPPPGFEAERQPVALPKSNGATTNAIGGSGGPVYVLSCAATSAADITAIYDREKFPNLIAGSAAAASYEYKYPNLYAGPTNGGVMPLDNSLWPTWMDAGGDTYSNNPLIASHLGVDGRGTYGTIDDYWVSYESTAPDPYITQGRAPHAWGDAIGDYMYSSQSAYDNVDGATAFYTYQSSADPLTCDAMANYGVPDGTLGRRNFYQARGYAVSTCYNQPTNNVIAGGFTFAQFKAEIDAGRPVLLGLQGHTVVGIGYDSPTNTVYLHDGWDYATHTMTWGGSYSGLPLLLVSIVNLVPIQPVYYSISGNAGVANATIAYTGGSTMADGNGNYSFTVLSGWSGTVTPSLGGDTFCPASHTYNNLQSNWTAQNFAHGPCLSFGDISRWTQAFDLTHLWTVQDYVRTVGDVNGDGKDDLVGFGRDGVYIALSTGNGFEPISRWTQSFDLAHLWTVQDYVRTVGDVNGDGKDDLVGFGKDGVYVATSTGTTFDPISRWTQAFDLAHQWTVQDYVRTVGDVNGDGKDDLVGFGKDGVYVALSTGTTFDAISRWTQAFDLSHGWTVQDYVRMVGDVNGDGKDDLVGFGRDGVYVATSTGTTFNSISRWTQSFDLLHGWTVSQFVRTVGDVNGDGKDDLVGFGRDGVYIGLSTGVNFALPSRRTTSFDLLHGWTVAQYVRTVGDVNGDGKADLVGFGRDGVYIATAQ